MDYKGALHTQFFAGRLGLPNFATRKAAAFSGPGTPPPPPSWRGSPQLEIAISLLRYLQHNMTNMPSGTPSPGVGGWWLYSHCRHYGMYLSLICSAGWGSHSPFFLGGRGVYFYIPPLGGKYEIKIWKYVHFCTKTCMRGYVGGRNMILM